MTEVFRCPVHGLIESPRVDDPVLCEVYLDGGVFCPINLSTQEDGITDDCCWQRCEGPFTYVATAELPGAAEPRWVFPAQLSEEEFALAMKSAWAARSPLGIPGGQGDPKPGAATVCRNTAVPDQGRSSGKRDSDPPRRDAAKPGIVISRLNH